MENFFAMGGYAAFVWPAYGLALFVLVLMLVLSRRGQRAAEREVAALEDASPRRRARGATAEGESE